MTSNFDTLIARATQLLDRIEAILPQPLSAPDWSAAIAWRYRKRSSGHGALEAVKHVAPMRLDDLDPAGIELFLDDVHVATRGGRNPSYREEDGQRVMKQQEITVRVGLGRGKAADQVWTCDFSHEYVTINADYRS